MKATYMFGPGDVRIIDAPDPVLKDSTDAVVRIVRACVCGSDLHPYHSMEKNPDGVSMGHEFIGVIDEAGSDVRTLSPGDLVIAPLCLLRRNMRILPGRPPHLLQPRRLLG